MSAQRQLKLNGQEGEEIERPYMLWVTAKNMGRDWFRSCLLVTKGKSVWGNGTTPTSIRLKKTWTYYVYRILDIHIQTWSTNHADWYLKSWCRMLRDAAWSECEHTCPFTSQATKSSANACSSEASTPKIWKSRRLCKPCTKAVRKLWKQT